MKTIDLTTLFLAGAGDQSANFVQAIIGYCLNSKNPPEIDIESGSVTATGKSLNFPELIAQTRSSTPDAVIVCIMPAEDDATAIARMMYHTFWKSRIQEYPESAVVSWPELVGQTSDPALCEAAFMSNVSTKCLPDDWTEIDKSAADLVIDFKTVMGLDTKDLNQIISDFLEIPRQSELDAFIEQFRTANQQYFS